MLQHDRKIAAILAADVVEYSRLMGVDERATVATLNQRRAIFDRLVADWGGREFGSVGDSLMAQFPSAVNAVQCAQALQQRMAEENDSLPSDQQMQLRIGVNLGDVIERNGALFGDAVNVAARIQALAKPGGVVISGAVHDQVRNKLAARFIDTGLRQVRNIAEPVSVFEVLPGAPSGAMGSFTSWLVRATSRRVRLGAAAVAALAVAVALGFLWREIYTTYDARRSGTGRTSQVVQPAPHSIAVLPLENMSRDAEQEYFVAGMQEALIADLSRISALRVISRTSANAFRGATKTLPQIGRELSVANLIEGSVLRVKDQVRITVQLIDAATDNPLWTGTYDRNVADVLTLQRELARLIARQVAATITPEEAKRLASARAVDPATYEAYLRGMFQLNQFTPEGISKGMAYLNEAVAKSPAEPLAYAGLALGYTVIGHGTGPREAFPKAKAAALRALELDPDLAEAHAALAEIKLYYDWDWKGAEESFRHALALNPSLDFAHAHYAWLLQLTGRIEDSFDEMKTARQLGPLTPLWSAWLGWLYWDAGRYAEAEVEARRSLEVSPDYPWALHVLGGVQAAQGKFTEAIATHQRAAAVMPAIKWGLGQTYAVAGRRDEARQIAAELARNPGPKDLMMLGAIYGILGETDEAFRWMAAAYEARVDWFPWIANPSLLGPLRGDPRFEDYVTRLGLGAVNGVAPDSAGD
jgi:class 3 adenylate cyclase/TolB-like protein/Flp pilus assembly protein TadD